MPKPLRLQRKNTRGAEAGAMRFPYHENDPVTQDLAFIDAIHRDLLDVSVSRLVLLRRVFKLYADYLQATLDVKDPIKLKKALADELDALLQAAEA